MSLTLKQLRYFIAAAETGQVSQAAVEMNISQSAVTAGIQGLEAQLGVKLLSRSAQGVAVTPEGARFLSRARSIMAALKVEGLTFSLDDFGTGFSSLGSLNGLEFDYLKIDKSFTDGVTGAPEQKAIVDMILALAKAMKIRTVAEGIETAAQAKALAAMGCDQGQGYYFARPVQVDALAGQVKASLAAKG